MEYLEGETLDDRLTRGPLPAPDVAAVRPQIADALDARASRADRPSRSEAEQRDADRIGREAAGFRSGPSGPARRAAAARCRRSPSITGKLTAEGTILGTFQYMAPEQLEGKEADARTDIFAFGTLVYEMATGRKAFEGASQASLIASILTEQPPAISDGAVEPTGCPPALDHVVERCLAKIPTTAGRRRAISSWSWNGLPTAPRKPSARSLAPRSRSSRQGRLDAGAVAASSRRRLSAVVNVRKPVQDHRFVIAPPSDVDPPVRRTAATSPFRPTADMLRLSRSTEGTAADLDPFTPVTRRITPARNRRCRVAVLVA